MRLRHLLLLGLGVALYSARLLPAGEDPAAGWRAGAASIRLTPAEPMWLAGYPSDRKGPYTRVTTDVWAQALVLEDKAGRRMAFVALDLHGVTRPLRDAVVAEAQRRYGLDPAALLLNASHTHCGPEIRDPLIARPNLAGERIRLAAQFRAEAGTKIVQVIGDAIARLQPAQVHFGQGRAGFAMNRRPDFTLPPDHPNVGVRPNPWGPVDHEVPVLQVLDARGRRTVALLFGYACHNTTLNGDQLSADYAGYARQYLEEAHPGAVALFVTGCAGDQNPYPRRGVALAEQHGRALANAVQAALGAARITLTPRLASALGHIPLAYAPPPARAELERRLVSRQYFEADHARLLLNQLDRGVALPSEYPCPVQVVRFGGELVLVALGGEVVVDYSLRLKREITDAKVWIAAYSNDDVTYVPSERVLAEGGYEGGRCMRYTETMGLHPGPWAPGLEEQIVAEVHRLTRATAEAIHR